MRVIETVNLVKRFKRQRGWRSLFSSEQRLALDGVSLQVERGEVFGILGPNGAGKTTLMKILSTLVLPSAGTASVLGMDVVQRSTEVRQRIGLVYGDERTFFWRLSVRENLLFYAALYRMPLAEAYRRTDELLEMVGLSHAADTRMHYFSTGMKQRAAIARGLLSQPDVIFMDEPTRSLDPVGTYDVHRLVQEHLLADGRRTVLLATNNMEEAEALCDRVALIHQGKVQLMGTVSELRRSVYGHDRHVLLLSGLTSHDLASLEHLPGVHRVEYEPKADGYWALALTVEHRSDAVPRVVRRVVEAGGSVWSCAPQTLSLDDIFRLAVRGDEHVLSGWSASQVEVPV
ncbi:MAG TPA: ABC transporter ATP-binding protein [Chloroflexota bacterium]|jgi:ABC-2 type transport system ATP-binding protein|nr:ABC transporter ATP-binding protein [Chloroflexota bacterium]